MIAKNKYTNIILIIIFFTIGLNFTHAWPMRWEDITLTGWDWPEYNENGDVRVAGGPENIFATYACPYGTCGQCVPATGPLSRENNQFYIYTGGTGGVQNHFWRAYHPGPACVPSPAGNTQQTKTDNLHTSIEIQTSSIPGGGGGDPPPDTTPTPVIPPTHCSPTPPQATPTATETPLPSARFTEIVDQTATATWCICKDGGCDEKNEAFCREAGENENGELKNCEESLTCNTKTSPPNFGPDEDKIRSFYHRDDPEYILTCPKVANEVQKFKETMDDLLLEEADLLCGSDYLKHLIDALKNFLESTQDVGKSCTNINRGNGLHMLVLADIATGLMNGAGHTSCTLHKGGCIVPGTGSISDRQWFDCTLNPTCGQRCSVRLIFDVDGNIEKQSPPCTFTMSGVGRGEWGGYE